MNQRKQNQKINNAVTVFMVYVVSGALIMYGGVNLSLNINSMVRGLFGGQWWAALPLILVVGLFPVLAGISLLILHPATRNRPKPPKPDQSPKT